MNKTLIFRCKENGSSLLVTAKQEKISKLVKWIIEFNHGTFDGVETINCNKTADFLACRIKAKHEGLISCTSKNKVKKRFASM